MQNRRAFMANAKNNLLERSLELERESLRRRIATLSKIMVQLEKLSLLGGRFRKASMRTRRPKRLEQRKRAAARSL
jgi:hypothetical protein